MDKYLLQNFYKLMVLMRSDIKNSKNLIICELILNAINSQIPNETLLFKLSEIFNLDDYQNFFSFDSGDNICIKNNELKIITVGVEEVLNCLQLNKYDFAYDLIDALHILPEVLSNNGNIELYDYWKTYFENLTKKYGISKFKMIKKCFGD